MTPNYVGRILTLARSRGVALVLASGVLLAGCASHVAPTVSLPLLTRLGPAGSQFKASFANSPTRTITKDSGAKQPQYGVGIEIDTTYATGIGPPEMDVSVDSLTNPVPPRRVNPFLRSYLATSHGGRIIKWYGLPAAEEFVPGCLPTGQCVGIIGNLVVLDGTTLYFVFTSQNSQTQAQEEVRSFRVVK
jgi:hypothetical protein